MVSFFFISLDLNQAITRPAGGKRGDRTEREREVTDEIESWTGKSVISAIMQRTVCTCRRR